MGNEKKLHKQDYKYKWQEKTMEDVSLERVQNVTKKYLSNTKPLFPLVIDNGRVIIAFLTQGWYEQYCIDCIDRENVHGDTWSQANHEKVISFSTEYNNYNIVVAEFWTEQKWHEQEIEEQKYYEDYARSYFGTSECSACRGGGCPHCEPSRFIEGHIGY